MTVPYENANAHTARAEIIKILQRFGCESVGFLDDYAKGTVQLVFAHRGNKVSLTASAQGWATLYLKAHPFHRTRSRISSKEYQDKALAQGLKAVNSILRDWIKGQVTAVECGILTFEGVFLPYMITADGRPLIDKLQAAHLLAPPDDQPRPTAN